jgi:hypothetical protein
MVIAGFWLELSVYHEQNFYKGYGLMLLKSHEQETLA